MFDFLHFLGFMAFNDAMEENNSSPQNSGGSDDDISHGCTAAVTMFIFAVFLGVGYSSWELFFAVSLIGILLGVLFYYIFDNKHDK